MRSIIIVAASLLALSCASLPGGGTSSAYSVTDYKGKELGAKVPTWVLPEARELEKSPEFAGQVVFKFESTGKNLENLKIWANTFSAPAEISQRVSTQVEVACDSVRKSTDSSYESYFSQVIRATSKLRILGSTKYADFWVLKNYGLGAGSKAMTSEYTYYVLYLIPRSDFERYLREAVDGASKTHEVPRDIAKATADAAAGAF